MAKSSVKLIIGDKKNPVRLSYANLFTATTAPGATEAKYGSAILVDKKDKVTVAAIQKAIKEVMEAAKFTSGGKAIPIAKLKSPLRDGDEEKPDDENYAGKFFFNASNKNRPGLVDSKGQKIIDPEEVYSGCYGVVSVNFYDFDTNGNRGVGAGLNHFMKLEDGEKLGGGASAEEDFGDLIDKDYGGLMG